MVNKVESGPVQFFLLLTYILQIMGEHTFEQQESSLADEFTVSHSFHTIFFGF